MSTSIESDPMMAEGKVDFIPDKDIDEETWEAFDNELAEARDEKNGLEVASVVADKVLLGKSDDLSEADRQLIHKEVERSRDKLPADGNLASADPIAIEMYAATAANAELAGEKVALSEKETRLLIEDFKQFKGKESYEEAAARKAARLNVLDLKDTSAGAGNDKSSLFNNDEKALLQARLDAMSEQGYEAHDIVDMAANMRLAGVEPIVSREVIEAAKEELYEAQDGEDTRKARELGSRLSVLAAKDIRRTSEGFKTTF